jgi:hypothetical protein
LSGSVNLLWIYVPDWDEWILAPPKCAATSFYHALAKHMSGGRIQTVSRADSLEVIIRYGGEVERLGWNDGTMIVRNPIDRFKSCWRDKCRDTAPREVPNKTHGRWKRDVAGMSPEEFYEYTLENDNQHWTPLTGRNLGGPVVAFEGIPKWWNRKAHCNFPHLNQTQYVLDNSFSPALIAKLRERYAEDLELHQYALTHPFYLGTPT